jgi:hypothetical protein
VRVITVQEVAVILEFYRGRPRAIGRAADGVLRSSPEPCPSGRRCNSRKVVWVRAHRGFKSHRFRH